MPDLTTTLIAILVVAIIWLVIKLVFELTICIFFMWMSADFGDWRSVIFASYLKLSPIL